MLLAIYKLLDDTSMSYVASNLNSWNQSMNLDCIILIQSMDVANTSPRHIAKVQIIALIIHCAKDTGTRER